MWCSKCSSSICNCSNSLFSSRDDYSYKPIEIKPFEYKPLEIKPLYERQMPEYLPPIQPYCGQISGGMVFNTYTWVPLGLG